MADKNIKSITILGSTGSIGTQSLDIIAQHRYIYRVNYLTILSNITLLEEQCYKFSPKGVVIADFEAYKHFIKHTTYKGKILYGTDGLLEAVSDVGTDVVISALVGIVGLAPTISAIRHKKKVLLANKETLVVAGKYVMDLADANKVEIIPIDSEHNAIFQCLVGEKTEDINKIILTASGGPFLNFEKSELQYVKVSDALRHPTWNMGKKVSVDSSTMMNKGFEVIEARWLFGIDARNKIDVVIHPQSIVHSMVEFIDGSIKMQMTNADMRFPISYALSYPYRIENNLSKFNFGEYSKFEFLPVPTDKYECLSLAYQCLDKGGNSCAILNAANEVVVSEFIKDKINFVCIPKILNKALENIDYIENPTLNDLFETDKITREYTNNLMDV